MECVMEGFLSPPVAVKCKLINYHSQMVLGKLGPLWFLRQIGPQQIGSLVRQIGPPGTANWAQVVRFQAQKFQSRTPGPPHPILDFFLNFANSFFGGFPYWPAHPVEGTLYQNYTYSKTWSKGGKGNDLYYQYVFNLAGVSRICDILHFKQCGLFLICSTSWQLASRPSAGAGEVSRDLSCQFVAHPSPGVTPVLP